MGQGQQAIEVREIAIAGQGNAAGLEGFRLAQVHIGQQQQPAARLPQSALRQQLQPQALPADHRRPVSGSGLGFRFAGLTHRCPITRW